MYKWGMGRRVAPVAVEVGSSKIASSVHLRVLIGCVSWHHSYNLCKFWRAEQECCRLL